MGPVTFSRSGAKCEWRVVWRVIEFVRISVWRRAIESRADKLPVEGMERKEGGTWRGEGGLKAREAGSLLGSSRSMGKSVTGVVVRVNQMGW